MAKSTKRNYWFKWHKTFLSVVIWIIILLLLFSVIWIAVLYINNPTWGWVTVQQQPVNIEDLNFEPIVETTPVVDAEPIVDIEWEGELQWEADVDGEVTIEVDTEALPESDTETE